MSLANMKRAEGTQDVALIECINPRKGTWRIRLDITETENGATWMEHDWYATSSKLSYRTISM